MINSTKSIRISTSIKNHLIHNFIVGENDLGLTSDEEDTIISEVNGFFGETILSKVNLVEAVKPKKQKVEKTEEAE